MTGAHAQPSTNSLPQAGCIQAGFVDISPDAHCGILLPEEVVTIVECCREALAYQARRVPPPRRDRERCCGVGVCGVRGTHRESRQRSGCYVT